MVVVFFRFNGRLLKITAARHFNRGLSYVPDP